MLTILFTVLMIEVFGKMIVFAFKACWGISAILLRLVLLPLVLIGLVIKGLMIIALPVLILLGIALLVAGSRV